MLCGNNMEQFTLKYQIAENRLCSVDGSANKRVGDTNLVLLAPFTRSGGVGIGIHSY